MPRRNIASIATRILAGASTGERSKYGRNATTRSETGTRDVPPAFGMNAPALLFDRFDLVTTTPSARDVDDEDKEDKEKEDDEFALPLKDAAIPEKATTGLFFFDLPLVTNVEGHSMVRRHRKIALFFFFLVVVFQPSPPRFSCAPPPVVQGAAFVVVEIGGVVSSSSTMMMATTSRGLLY